jgi:hypothetical protein
MRGRHTPGAQGKAQAVERQLVAAMYAVSKTCFELIRVNEAACVVLIEQVCKVYVEL